MLNYAFLMRDLRIACTLGFNIGAWKIGAHPPSPDHTLAPRRRKTLTAAEQPSPDHTHITDTISSSSSASRSCACLLQQHSTKSFPLHACVEPTEDSPAEPRRRRTRQAAEPAENAKTGTKANEEECLACS